MSLDAYQQFLRLRWPPDGKPVCPRCESSGIYTLSTRGTFKCKACKLHFSATSRTVFASTKLPFDKIIALIERKDLNAIKASEELDIQYKAAWVLCSKIREARRSTCSVANQPVSTTLKGYFQRSRAYSDQPSRDRDNV